MKTNKNNTPPPAHIHPRATETLNLRLLPEIRSFIEREAEFRNVSLTRVALSAFELLYAARQQQASGLDSLYY
jgi:uncharacterized protein (DUF1778 family)